MSLIPIRGQACGPEKSAAGFTGTCPWHGPFAQKQNWRRRRGSLICLFSRDSGQGERGSVQNLLSGNKMCKPAHTDCKDQALPYRAAWKNRQKEGTSMTGSKFQRGKSSLAFTEGPQIVGRASVAGKKEGEGQQCGEMDRVTVREGRDSNKG